MIKSKWGAILKRKRLTQTVFAKRIGVNAARVSMAINGVGVLDRADFDMACEYLGCKPTDVYEADVLKLVYGMDADVSRKNRTTSVKIDGETCALVDAYAAAHGLSRGKAIKEMITEDRP